MDQRSFETGPYLLLPHLQFVPLLLHLQISLRDGIDRVWGKWKHSTFRLAREAAQASDSCCFLPPRKVTVLWSQAQLRLISGPKPRHTLDTMSVFEIHITFPSPGDFDSPLSRMGLGNSYLRFQFLCLSVSRLSHHSCFSPMAHKLLNLLPLVSCWKKSCG